MPDATDRNFKRPFLPAPPGATPQPRQRVSGSAVLLAGGRLPAVALAVPAGTAPRGGHCLPPLRVLLTQAAEARVVGGHVGALGTAPDSSARRVGHEASVPGKTRNQFHAILSQKMSYVVTAPFTLDNPVY